MSEEPWIVIQKHGILDSEYMRVWKEHISIPHKARTIVDFYQYWLPDVSLVVPIQDTSVLMFYQYRHGLRDKTYTLPGGQVEAGESPLDGAKREFLEETGYVAEDWKMLGSFLRDGSKGGGHMHFFIARNLRYIYPPTEPDNEGGETLWMDFDDALKLCRFKGVDTIGTAAALALASPHIERK
jgi:8-oxo-dGTP pyrophosphatase MutT (NUDIX family)